MNNTSTTLFPSSTVPTLPTTSSSPIVVPPISSSSSSQNDIATDSLTTAVPTDTPTTSSSSSVILPTTSTSETSTTPPPTTSSTSTSETSTSTSNTPTSTSSDPTTSTPEPSTVTTPPPTTRTSIGTNPQGSTVTTIITSIQGPVTVPGTKVSESSASATETTGLQPGSAGGNKGLTGGGTIAVAVVVPIVAVALIVLAGLFFWRKRKARKDAEELRRREVEDYGYNPNNDPTLPPTGTAGSDGAFEMREEGSSGYRGWGTTAVPSSTGRKASTTLSGGQSAGGIGMAYSEGTSATGAPSDNRSDQPLVDGSPVSGEGEHLGAMGPAASGNRASDINRGPSNASSSYSAANRSDGSGELNQGGQYYNQYDTGNPYGGGDQYGGGQGPTEMPAQPVIRDVQARRNTRIENPSHFPQQSAGISQNF